MLSLNVKEGDYLLIGDNIRIHVQKGIGNNMKIGIEAPRAVPIVRGKVYERNLLEDPWGNLEELEANRAMKDDFKKDTERVAVKYKEIAVTADIVYLRILPLLVRLHKQEVSFLIS